MTSYIDINIRKPVFGNFCYIRETYIKQARREGKLLKITTPNGTGIISPDDWEKNGKVLLKEFKIPGRPMRLVGNHVPIDSQK